jgi:2-methylcitrate dehydratase PrpD
MVEITRRSADFVAGLQRRDIPDICADAARVGMLDCVGVMIAGAAEQPVAIVASMVTPSLQNDGAPEIPSGRNLDAPDAALVNGVAAHVLDYDDVAIAGHPSTVLTPAILAEGWTLDASGEDAIAAYVAGYELWAQLLELEPGHLHERGFHPTAVMGTLAAAAACARLQRLDSEKTMHAIAIAASLASGLVANFGTMTKSLHAGRSAQSGVLAARLAARGFTGSPDAIEHRTGFLRAHSPSGTPHVEDGTIDLGQHWRLSEIGINVKRYPTCYATHRSIDAMLGLLQTRPLRADDIRQMTASLSQNHATILRNHAPDTGLAAKFSIEFALAGSVLAGKIGLAELTDDFVRRADVRALMRRVRTEISTDLDPAMSGAARFDQVRIELADGGVIETEEVARATGHPARPLSDAQLYGKFRDCLEAGASDIPAETLFGRLEAMPRYTARQITAPA